MSRYEIDSKNLFKVNLFYTLMCLAGLLIILLPVGIANIVFGYIFKDSPCTLCWGQREAMMFIGVLALFIVRFGFRFKYIAALLIVAAFGLYQSFAQFALHAGRDLNQGFSMSVFGIHTYFWAEIIFWAVIVVLGILFLFAPKLSAFEAELGDYEFRLLNKFNKYSFLICIFIIASNAIQAFISTGIPPYYGQGDPIRFSLNPKFIIWDKSGYANHYKTISFLGKRDVAAPDYAFLPADESLGITWSNDSNKAPLEVETQLNIEDFKEIKNNLALNTLINFDNGYVASSKWDVFFYDFEFNLINDLKIDPYFSATVDPLISVVPTFNNEFILMGSNKTLLKIKPNDEANPSLQWANFIKGYDSFDGLKRARIDTVRSKLYNIGSATSNANTMYLATLPNNKSKGFFIQEISLNDYMLNAEWQPNADLKEGRSLGELYITSMVYKDGFLYALSKQFNLILRIELASKTVVQTMAFPSDIKNARALYFDEDKIKILSYQNNTNILYTLN